MCGCRAGSPAPALAARSGMPAAMIGLAPDNPYIIGDPSDTAPQRVRVVQNIGPLRSQQAAWVAGDGVQDAFDTGLIILLGSQPQMGMLWRVGRRTYHSRSIAERVAAKTGQVVVEVG